MDITKREKYGLIIFIIVIITVVSFFYYNNKKNSIEVITKGSNESSESYESTESKNEIRVYVCGEITKPGVYSLLEGDRLIKLIEIAGGFTQSADMEAVNLAEKLVDEAFIKIPELVIDSNGEKVNASNTSGAQSMGKIDINTATKEQLETLPRIGEAIAQRIIDYRENNGRFKDINEINNVSGIGDKIFEAMKDKITVH
ncbi:MAG: transporter [Clostridiales bacterium]|jgi:competence protein ComEA|nr:transporter [Clostridiales bacterium]